MSMGGFAFEGPIRGRFSEPLKVTARIGSGSRVKQSFKKDCDINLILGKYAKGGVINHLAKYGGRFGDFPAQDFQEAMNICAKAQEMFADLPSEVRKRFNQSPFDFLSFANELSDDGKSLRNIDELRKLGLAKPAAVPEPTALDRRLEELAVDKAARLEIARRAITEPPGGSGGAAPGA